MTYTFDYFVGELKCSDCGHITDKSEQINMQTKICRTPRLARYSIGDKLEIDHASIGYVTLTPPKIESSFSLIDCWDCPNCGKTFNWARITIHQDTIQLMESIELNSDNIASTNYINEEVIYFGWRISDGIAVKTTAP